MAINDLSALISTEQDIKFARKEQSQQSSLDAESDSASDFFSQLQSANSAAEEPNTKNKGSASPDASDIENVQAKQKGKQTPALSGDDMLAQINAANNLDTRVNTSESEQPLTSVSNLIDKYAQESLDPKSIEPKAPRPIDAVTPIINVPLEDDSNEGATNKPTMPSDKSAVAEAIDKNLKQTGFPEDAVTPIVDEIKAIKVSDTQAVINKSTTDAGSLNANAPTNDAQSTQPLVSAMTQEPADNVLKSEEGVLAAQLNKNKTGEVNTTVLMNSDAVIKDSKKVMSEKGEVNPEVLTSALNKTGLQNTIDEVNTTANKPVKNDNVETKSVVSAPMSDNKDSVEILSKHNKDSQAESSMVSKSADKSSADPLVSVTQSAIKADNVEPSLAKDAQALKEAFIAAQSVTTSSSSKVTQSVIANSPEVNQTAIKLLNAETDVLTSNDPVLARLTPAQRTTLQTEVTAILNQGGDKQGVANLKNTIAQFIVNNNSADTARNMAADSGFNAAEFSDEIATLTTGQKQALSNQLQQFIATEKPQGAVLNQVNSALAVLEEDQVTMTKESIATLKEPAGGTQPLATNPVETNKSPSGQAAFAKVAAQEQAIKSDIQQDLVKEALIADDENTEQLTAKESSTVRVNQLFTQVTNGVNATVSAPVTEAVDQRYLQELSDMQVHNAQQTNAASQTKQVNVDPTLLQALNIVKSDAAKLLQERVSALLSINNKEAEIRLDPPEMGSMQIRIRSDAEQAQINFVVQNQQAKEALEQSMPKLREMLAEQGIELGESSIQQGEGQSNGDEQEQQGRGQLASNGQRDDGEADSHVTTQGSGQQSSSSIDYYA